MPTDPEIEARESLIRDLLTQSAGSGTKRRNGLVHQTGRCGDYLLWVPILGGQMVKIKLSRFDEREFPRGFFEYTDDETTFPVFNGLFHYENATRQMAEQRTITQPGIDGYPAGFYSHIGTYQFNFPCRTELSNNAKDGSLRAQGTVSWETFKHNGHMWPEVYIPSARRWAVLEPYNTEASPFLHYPSLKGDMAFILEGAVYPRTGGELKIDISFSKQTAGYLT